MIEKRPHPITTHGHTRIDDYYWLRDDQRKDPDVLAFLQAENNTFNAVMGNTFKLQERLYDEMTLRLDPDESSVPYQRGDYWYYSYFSEDLEYPIYARRKGNMQAEEEILLDTNQRAEGHEYYALGGLAVSDDHRYVAIAEDTVSRRIHQLRILDLQTGAFISDLIEGASSSLAWSADGAYLFYLKKHPETLLAYQMMRHEVGTASSGDVLVYEEKDNTFYTSLRRSRSRDYIFLYHHSTETTEIQLMPASEPLAPVQPFLPRESGHEYDIDHANGRFYICTNWQAVNFRVMSCSLEDSGDKSKWQALIEARDDAMVDSIQAFDRWLVLGERKDGLKQVRILAHDGSVDKYIDAPESVYSMWPDLNVSTQTDKIRYGYSSLITPTQILEIDLTSDTTELLKQEIIGGGFAKENFRTERMKLNVGDGTQVPVSLVYHRDTPLDGSAPTLIYAYGSYGYCMDPSFRSSIISLLERGFIYAIAHVRGGQEMGRTWYDDGKKLNKFNTFYDFVDVTKELQNQNIIDPGRTYAMGGSAGGLLMGVIINLAPALYHGVIAAVPFVDVVTTMLDESIPLTTGEFDEWGNPKTKEYYDYMLSYSPYDQVKRQDYPNLMVTTGLHDSQVQYWEPAKWVAKIRQMRSNHNLLIMHTDMDTGHGGASGRYKRLKEIAREYAFLLHLANQA
jgi:oligopeptidase B